ncbi:MAG: UDP-N-acetylglucosamine 1-carboxyvinyltransferase [Clostridia bacterium]|nr:UDP-N-acetylglucosamine 1-carboxyvinyltransferase [Clostridia bacterium]
MMKEKLRIHGGARLEGEVTVSGGKNAAVAILPAALLGDSPSVIENVPDINDVHIILDMLAYLGAQVEFRDNVVTIDPRTADKFDPPYDLACQMRASYYFAPVLLGVFKRCEVPLPGGCDLGLRPIDQTLKGMRILGADVDTPGGVIIGSAEELIGGDIYLDMPSVGATVNCMLTAVSASGTTCIHNAAKEPHIVDLANFLSSMGASVKGAGTDVIRIRGGRHLHGANYTVVPDQIETGTLMIAAAATGGDVTITGAIPTHMEALSAKLLEMGVHVSSEDDIIHVRSNRNFRAVNVKTQGYPGFPTDLQQPLSALLTVANGTSIVTETIFESRFRFLDELRKMGANSRVIDTTAIITGVDRLVGARVNATDLRAGASLVIAALMAEGVTEISGVEYIMRGYEHFDEKLRTLGAHIEHIQGLETASQPAFLPNI